MLPTRPLSALRIGAPLVAMLLAGCVGAPGLGPRPVPRAPADSAAEQSLAPTTQAAWPAGNWWRGYGDAQLGSLIEEGLARSPDVAAAAARFRRASGMAAEAGAARLPQLDAQGGASLEKQSYNMGFPKEFVPKGWLDYGQVSAGVGFDLDVWGRNRAAHAAATSEARAAAIDVEQARLMLSTGIALAYFDLARLFSEREVREAGLAARTASARLVAERLANGLETRGSLRQSEAEVASARADLLAAEQGIALRRNQIAALLGAGPDRGLQIAAPALSAPSAGGVPAGATTELIGRRPDIAAARERVEAAARRIDVARADFFPAIRLEGLIGLQSLGLDNLFKSDSTVGSAGPAISLPIFRGGALRGRYTGARGTYDEAVASYDGTVLAAYQQVADAVTGQRLLAQRLSEARAALAASEEAYEIARLRYQGGLSRYLDVLAVEDRVLVSRLAVANIDADLRSLDITLIRALGGGFGGDAGPVAKDDPNG